LTLPPPQLDAFRAAAQKADVEITEIGRIVAGEGVRFIRDGKALTFARPSYSHF
jgi:thiamine monophosphate kinase